LSITQISKTMKRSFASVRDRVLKLKTGTGVRTYKSFSLAEDKIIMETALSYLEKENSIECLSLRIPGREWVKLVRKQFKTRKYESLASRWENQLKIWILQLRAGTLNLEIDSMLVNYLVDHFQDIESIDWSRVAARKEFSGHTESSLRNIFFSKLFKNAKKSRNILSSEINLKDIADVVDVNKYEE